MKLIDILVEELPKRGGWPEGAVAITQDSDKAINNYKTSDGLETNEHGTWRYSSAWEGYSLLASDSPCLASDYDTAIITREQYEAALAASMKRQKYEHPVEHAKRVADAEGWIEWPGGECPVEKGTLVDVRYRDGQELSALPANDIAPSQRDASYAFWRNDENQNDIIAYRLRQPQEVAQDEATPVIDHFEGAPEWATVATQIGDKKYFLEHHGKGARGLDVTQGREFSIDTIPEAEIVLATRELQQVAQTEAEQEADLNDCIGQTPAPVWNGEGLPPVGCEFEYGSHRTKAKCLAVAHHMVFASKGNPDDDESDYEEFMISILDSEFHRVRTEAERRREEAVKTIMLTGWCQTAAEEIYDLVAAGKVPGMKLGD